MKYPWNQPNRLDMRFQTTISLFLLFWLLSPIVHAQDMRALQVQARETRQGLIENALKEKADAEKAAAQSREQIMQARKSLEKAITALESANTRLEKESKILLKKDRVLNQQETQLTEKLKQTDRMIDELVGAIRVSAKDVDGLIIQNPQTVMDENPVNFLDSVAQQSHFPDMDDVRALAQGLLDQIAMTGQVSIHQSTIIDRTGRESIVDTLFLGPFTAIYRIGDEVGFCNYSESGKKLYALSRLPSGRMQKQIARYLSGKSEAVPMDISRGGALRQLTHELILWKQIPKGGPIVWPILILLVAGVLIVIERVIFLLRRHLDADHLTHRIEKWSAENNWQQCEKECKRYKKKPVARVLSAGLDCRHMQREEMENALQEAILKEIPPMERFLSTLGMLAAIAPLLGLLGTVTGMIDTFHVITLHGTGDPRLMSGGISEALVTTMLGLSVAIPLMLSQTLLNRAVEKNIGEMEEKAVTLVNIIHKNREAK